MIMHLLLKNAPGCPKANWTWVQCIDLKAGSDAFAYKISASRRQAARCKLAVAESDAVHESMTQSLEKSRKK